MIATIHILKEAKRNFIWNNVQLLCYSQNIFFLLNNVKNNLKSIFLLVVFCISVIEKYLSIDKNK